MTPNTIEITLTSYRIDEAEKELILAIWKNEPQMTIEEMSAELGISSRTLHRKIREMNLEPKGSLGLLRKIDELKKLGFIVTSPNATH